MVERKSPEPPKINPLVRELMTHGDGKVLSIGGYVGPAGVGRLRLYADLGLRTYIELSMTDIVRVVEPKNGPHEPSTVYFRRDAEVVYTQTATMRADQVLTAVMAAPTTSSEGGCGCGCRGGEGARGVAARQSGGGPVVDICQWSCTERLRLCVASSRTFSSWWCYLNYGFCRLGCIDPPIIAV